MQTAIVLINTGNGPLDSTAQAITKIKDVVEVYSVTGNYDLIAFVRITDTHRLPTLVTKKILAQDGVKKATTLLAFRVYNKEDLERIFTVGFEHVNMDRSQ